MARKSDDGYGRDWILPNAQEIIGEYDEMTVRQLYYQLVSRGMPNSLNHYKRVVAAMTDARWSGDVSFNTFIDRERETYWSTDSDEKDLDQSIDDAKFGLIEKLGTYFLNKWSNQNFYPVIWIEKKALQGTFEPKARRHDVELLACKGYPSLTALNEAKNRFYWAVDKGQTVIILYFGDHDPSGDNIPETIANNLNRFGLSTELIDNDDVDGYDFDDSDVVIVRVALTKQQVIDMGLSPAPTKRSDSRSASWDGLGQVELDAVRQDILRQMVDDAIEPFIDRDLESELRSRQATERRTFRETLIDYVQSGDFEKEIADRYGGL